jgi:cation:H+ antiporter
MIIDVLLLVLGLAVLIFGGELLVKGSVKIARYFSLSPLVIGMTVVAFGTSAPELIVSVKAALSGSSQIAIGNVIGSNIANLGIVLGLTALIFPLQIERQSVRVDWPVMMAATILFYLFMLNGVVSQWEGIVLFALLVIYLVWLLNFTEPEIPEEVKNEENTQQLLPALLLVGGGLVGLYFGSEWLLKSAISIAKNAGVSEHVIGVTIIAFGTSVPELATSVIAAFRKQTDISIGNLIGSNIFNIMAVIGITGIIKPISIAPVVLSFDVFFMIGIALLLFPMMTLGRKITRGKGFTLLIFYVAYIALLLNH